MAQSRGDRREPLEIGLDAADQILAWLTTGLEEMRWPGGPVIVPPDL